MSKLFTAVIVSSLLAGSSALADEARTWKFPVENVVDGKKVDAEWEGFQASQVTKPWDICVLFPHVKDPLWVAADYGITDEAARLGVSVQLYEAGGYGNLSTQLNQMDNCIAQNVGAIILGSISSDGANPLIRKAQEAGIPVVDLINGVTEPTISARAVVSYYEASYLLGKHIVETAGGEHVKVGYFPGPEGATFADDAVKGLQDAIKDAKNVELVVVRRGDTSLNVQLDLVENALQAYPELNYIAGVDIAAQAAGVAVRNAGLQGSVKIGAYTIIPPVYEDIRNGVADGAVVDFVPIQGRMAVDMAVSLLEHIKLPAWQSGPKLTFVTETDLKGIAINDVFGPRNFRPVFQVKPE